jgi:hypothetical protein
MGVFQNNLLAGAAAAASAGGGAFYDFQIEQSLRIEYGSANYLERAIPSGAGTNAKWSVSCWVKRSKISTDKMVLIGNAAGYQQNQWDADDTFHMTTGGGSGDIVADDNFKFRDTNGWYHMAFGAGSNSSERFIYVNGVALTKDVDGWNGWSLFYGGQTTQIGASNNSSSGTRLLSGYIAELHCFYDHSLTYTDFGEFKNGVWIPKQYTGGNYGTYGFYLKFENASDLGNDSSGNNNDFTSVGLGADHQVLDSPTFGS